MENKILFVIMNVDVDVDNVDTNKLISILPEKTFENIDKLTYFMMNDCKLRINEFIIMPSHELCEYLNGCLSFDNDWFTYTKINS